MKIVLDADVIVAALRSPSGASAELLRRARQEQITLAASGSSTGNPLVQWTILA
jgi:predicted nucleic acid-binding protein